MTRLPVAITLLATSATACVDSAANDEIVVERASLATADADISPALQWLEQRSEAELAALFASGVADHVPLGENRGIPLLPGKTALVPVLARLYEGSIWEQRTDSTGQPLQDADGDPLVVLRDKFLPGPDGHLLTLFEGRIDRGPIPEISVRSGTVAAPIGTSWPHPLVPFDAPIVTDDRTSLFVDYSADPTPLVNRILDEIRAVDPGACPGLYLGRAHFLQPWGEWVYLYYFGLDFGTTDSCTLTLP